MDKVELIYTKFVSLISSDPIIQTLLPLTPQVCILVIALLLACIVMTWHATNWFAIQHAILQSLHLTGIYNQTFSDNQTCRMTGCECLHHLAGSGSHQALCAIAFLPFYCEEQTLKRSGGHLIVISSCKASFAFSLCWCCTGGFEWASIRNNTLVQSRQVVPLWTKVLLLIHIYTKLSTSQ